MRLLLQFLRRLGGCDCSPTEPPADPEVVNLHRCGRCGMVWRWVVYPDTNGGEVRYGSWVPA